MAVALTTALDVVLREDVQVPARLEVSAAFGAWLEWLLQDEATQARLLRSFEAGCRAGLSRDTLELAAEDVYSSVDGVDVCSATKGLWRFVSARLVQEASYRPSSGVLEAHLGDLQLRLKSADCWSSVVAELQHLAARWRMSAWLGCVYPLEEMRIFGGLGNLFKRHRCGWE